MITICKFYLIIISGQILHMNGGNIVNLLKIFPHIQNKTFYNSTKRAFSLPRKKALHDYIQEVLTSTAFFTG